MSGPKPIVDKHSDTWLAVKAHVLEALAAHERICRTSGTPITDTENARGAIVALEGLLKFGDPSIMHSRTKADSE